MTSMDEVEVVLKRFGDEQSTLFDRYERLSFEVQLNQAILDRSLSEPSGARNIVRHAPPPPVSRVAQGPRHHRGLGFQKMLKKLLKPILGQRVAKTAGSPDQKDFKSLKAFKFSRSLRV